MILEHSCETAPPTYGEGSGHWLKEYCSSVATAGHSKGTKGHYDEAPDSSSDPPPTYSFSADVDIPDDTLALLNKFDTVFLVDDSTTMKEVDKRGFLQRGTTMTRWELACATLVKYGKIAAHHDADGIDVHFLNCVLDKTGVKNTGLKTEAEISALFHYARPNGPTYIGSRLTHICADYLEELKNWKRSSSKTGLPKARNYIIITDGAPTSPDEVTNFLRDTAQLLVDLNAPPNQLGFQFVQIGDDAEATDFLNYLDTSAKFKRDIVDTVKSKDTQNIRSKFKGLLGMDKTAIMCSKLLLGGIERSIDRKGDVRVKGAKASLWEG